MPGEKGRYFVKTDKSDCKTYPAKISWEWCNRKDQNLVYAKNKAAIHFGDKNDSNNFKSLYDFKAKQILAANTCDDFSVNVNLDSCKKGQGVQWFDIILQGNINGQDKCFCYEFNQAFSLISDGPSPTSPPSLSPTPGNTCDGSDFKIVTVADPVDNKDARYIELYSPTCGGKTISSDLTLFRIGGRSNLGSPLRLQGHKVKSDGTIVICNSSTALGDKCDFSDGSGASVVDAIQGTGSIILENGGYIQDRYGFDSFLAVQDITDGGAQRLCASQGPNEIFKSEEWDITPGSGSGTRKAETFLPGYWKSCCATDGTPRCKTASSGCYPDDILFTEFADPSDTPSGRYVEMYSKKCAGQEVGDIDLVRIPSERWLSLEPNTFSLKGKEFDHDGFMVVCFTIDANTVYGRGKCDYFADQVGNADGKSTFKILDSDLKVLDIYGYEYALTDTVPNPLPSDFSHGRAVRNQMPLQEGVERNTHVWFPSQWMISKAMSKDMDPGEWVDPPPIMLLTEISYPTDNALHFIEISSPNLQGTHIRDPLHLVTYSQGSSTPDLYSISLFGEQVGHDGFLLLCSTDYVSQAYNVYDACDITDLNLGDLNTFDAIAIVKGVVNGAHPDFDIIDIYGVIGSSPIADSEGRAVRKFYATSPRSEFVPDDWIKMSTDEYLMSDPREWKYEKPIVNDDDGCEIDDLIITEIADPQDDKMMRYIEVYSPSTCAHGKKLGDFSIVSHTGSVGFQLTSISLKGYRLDDRGFLVICVGQASYCNAFAGAGSVVDNDGTHAIAIRYHNTIIDVYGGSFAAQHNTCVYSSGSGWYTGFHWHCFTNGRVVRRKNMMVPSVDFRMDYWVVILPISWYSCDPGSWVDPYCFICDVAPTPIMTHVPSPTLPTPSPVVIPIPPTPSPVVIPIPPVPSCNGYHCCPSCYNPQPNGKGKSSSKKARVGQF